MILFKKIRLVGVFLSIFCALSPVASGVIPGGAFERVVPKVALTPRKGTAPRGGTFLTSGPASEASHSDTDSDASTHCSEAKARGGSGASDADLSHRSASPAGAHHDEVRKEVPFTFIVAANCLKSTKELSLNLGSFKNIKELEEHAKAELDDWLNDCKNHSLKETFYHWLKAFWHVKEGGEVASDVDKDLEASERRIQISLVQEGKGLKALHSFGSIKEFKNALKGTSHPRLFVNFSWGALFITLHLRLNSKKETTSDLSLHVHEFLTPESLMAAIGRATNAWGWWAASKEMLVKSTEEPITVYPGAMKEKTVIGEGKAALKVAARKPLATYSVEDLVNNAESLAHDDYWNVTVVEAFKPLGKL